MEELKNCPFCDSSRVELLEKKSRGAEGRDKFSYYVKCHNCRARGPSYSGKSANANRRGFAIYYWNNAGGLK